MKVKLIRVSQLEKETLGVLCFDNRPLFVTLELPWRNNEVSKSCIKDGVYNCSPFMSKKFGSTFVVENVEGRSGILFHAGNSHKDTNGCILVGTYFILDREERGVNIASSQLAMDSMRKLLKDTLSFKLEIVTYQDYEQ